MNPIIVLFGVVLAVILFQANRGSAGLLIGGAVLAGVLVLPWLEDAISARRLPKRPPPPRRPGFFRSGRRR
ncbi:MAG: hypothetical protein WCF85_10180 [Rhodospirillaceae bacterium]